MSSSSDRLFSGMTPADHATWNAQRSTKPTTGKTMRLLRLSAAEYRGSILGRLMYFIRGSNDPLQGYTKYRNLKASTDTLTLQGWTNYNLPAIPDVFKVTAIILYSRVGREEGAVEEADALESGFRTQGSHVIRHEWVTVSDLQDKLQHFIRVVPSDCQMMFVCVMSHGAPGVLCGADGVKLPLNDLLDRLKALPAKLPLVMLVQACQNTNTEDLRQSEGLDAKFQIADATRASPPESSICPHIDLTRPHTVLLRSTVTGGYSRRGAYTEALAHQIGSADGNKSIHEMHEDAVQAMMNKFGVEDMDEIGQVPEYRDTLQGKKLVLQKAETQYHQGNVGLTSYVIEHYIMGVAR